jgi:hypothetical protein
MLRSRPWLAGFTVALLLTLPLAPSASAAEPAGEPAERTVQLSVRLEPDSRYLDGEMVLAPPPTPARFCLLPSLEVGEATAGETPLTVERRSEGCYRLAVPEAAESLTIRWRGTLEGEDGRLRVSSEGSLLPAASGWYPRFAELGAFALSLAVQVPEGQRAVGTGSLVGDPQDDTSGYRVRHEHPRIDAVELAVGPWQERQRTVNGVRLRTLFPAELDEAHAETYLEHAARYLVPFSERVGPYPYQSFTIAASPAPVGLAFPGFTLLGERVIPLPFIPHTSLAHELMHAWWGAGVRVDYATGNWSEALTTYLADYYLDEQRGDDRDTRRRWLIDLAALPESREARLVDFHGGADPTLRLLGYLHGAMLFHMLRNRLGDDAFDAGLRRFAEQHMFHTASWDDLAAAFSEAAGEELADVIDAWAKRPGRPALTLEAVERRETADGWEVRGVLEQSGPGAPWPLSVPLVVETEAGDVRHEVALTSRRGEFSLPLADAPRTLAMDPDFDLLRQLDDAPVTLRRLALDPHSRLLALDDGLAPIVQRALERPLVPAEVPPRDDAAPLLVVGETDGVAAWLDEQDLPDPPSAMARQGRARIWTLPGTQVVALSGDGRDALQRLAGVVRHHLYRSYLVQEADGEIGDAGVWPMDEERLRVDFIP